MDQKENQPLELEELDLTLPDDLSGGGDFSADSGLDDLDLDLPELTGEEESDPMNLSSGADADLLETSAAPAGMEAEDEEPIALSEEELERIMGSSDAGLTGDFAESEEMPAVEPEMEAAGSEVPDLDLADAGTDISGDFGAAAEAPLPEMDMDFGDMHTDLEDEGPVALSEEELGSIMGDVSEQLDAPHTGPDDTMLEPDFGDDLGMPEMEEPLAVESASPLSSGLEEDDENITLSDDELNNILLDASDLEIAKSVEPAEAPRLSEMGLDEEDEPIALTAEELGNIISDVSEVADAGEHEMPAASGILDEVDEGPVALSDDELNSILEDVHEEPADAVSAEEPSRNLIVLDEYEDREKAEETQGRDAAIERAALSSGVEKTELKKMIGYLDQLFDKLPEETIREFSSSEYFDLYKRIMRDLGLS